MIFEQKESKSTMQSFGKILGAVSEISVTNTQTQRLFFDSYNPQLEVEKL